MLLPAAVVAAWPYHLVRSWRVGAPPSDVAWGYDNFVYVSAEVGGSGVVYKYTAEGRLATSWTLSPEYAPPAYITATPLFIYTCDAGDGAGRSGVSRYTHAGSYVNRADVKMPLGITANESGYVLVLTLGFLRMYDAELAPVGSWRCPAARGLAADRMAYCYAGEKKDVVLKFTINGTLLYSLPTPGVPWDVAVGEDGLVMVSATSPPRIDVFTSAGEYAGSFGEDLLVAPRGLTVAPNGDVYVADLHGPQIYLYRPGTTATTPRSLGRIKALFRP